MDPVPVIYSEGAKQSAGWKSVMGKLKMINTEAFIKSFVKERDEALLSMDVKRIREYAKKYHVPCPKKDEVVLAGAAKAIRHLTNATQEQKAAAEKWLLEHGFRLEMF